MQGNDGIPFYKVLEELERRKGWGEREVLQRLGVPRSTYRSWRDGTSEPSKRLHWIKLAETFGVSVESLIRCNSNLTVYGK